MRAPVTLLCLFALLGLPACGPDEPPPTPPTLEVYHLDPVALGHLLAAKRSDALAHLPEADRTKALDVDPERLRALASPLSKRYIVRLILRSDATCALTLREQAVSGAWAITEASGSWSETPSGVSLAITMQEGVARLPPRVEIRRTERGYELPARGRVFPIHQIAR